MCASYEVRERLLELEVGVLVLAVRAQLRLLRRVGVLRVALLADAHLLRLLRLQLTALLTRSILNRVLLALRSALAAVAAAHGDREQGKRKKRYWKTQGAHRAVSTATSVASKTERLSGRVGSDAAARPPPLLPRPIPYHPCN